MTTLRESLIVQGWKVTDVNPIRGKKRKGEWVLTGESSQGILQHVVSVGSEDDLTLKLCGNLPRLAAGDVRVFNMERRIADRMTGSRELSTVFLGPGIVSIEPLEVDRDGDLVGLWMIAGTNID